MAMDYPRRAEGSGLDAPRLPQCRLEGRRRPSGRGVGRGGAVVGGRDSVGPAGEGEVDEGDGRAAGGADGVA